MRVINKMFRTLGIVFAVFVILTSPAYAYIDPGTGSMIIQAIAAFALTLGALFSIFRRKIKGFFSNMGKRKKDGVEENK